MFGAAGSGKRRGGFTVQGSALLAGLSVLVSGCGVAAASASGTLPVTSTPAVHSTPATAKQRADAVADKVLALAPRPAGIVASTPSRRDLQPFQSVACTPLVWRYGPAWQTHRTNKALIAYLGTITAPKGWVKRFDRPAQEYMFNPKKEKAPGHLVMTDIEFVPSSASGWKGVQSVEFEYVVATAHPGMVQVAVMVVPDDAECITSHTNAAAPSPTPPHR